MNIIADLHTHTIASTHAYATVTEMAKAAADKNLYAIAITDHGRNMPGGPGPYYFECLSLIPEKLFSVRVLKGMEADIIDFNGSLDADDALLSGLDFVVASMHMPALPYEPSIKKCTEAYLAVCDNKNVNAIGHSGSPYYAYDYETVIKRCAQTDTLIEINNASFGGLRKGDPENCRKIAKLCKKHSARVVVNSDAHFWSAVGSVENAVSMLTKIDFPPELIVNSSIENFKEYCSQKNIML